MKAKPYLHGHGQRRCLTALLPPLRGHEGLARRTARTAFGTAACLLTTLAILVVPAAARAGAGVAPQAPGGSPAAAPVGGPTAGGPITVEAGADPTLGLAPLRVSFWAYLTGPGAAGAVGTWRWDFGDGTNSTAPYVAHTYKNPGSYTAKVTFTDRDGHTYGDWFTIDVRRPLATVTITAEPNPAFVQSGQTSTEVTYTMSFKNPLSEPPGLWAWHVTIYPVGKKGSMGASFWTSGTSYKLPEDLAVGTYEVLVVVQAGDGGQDVAAGMTTNQVIPVPKSPTPPPSPTPTPGKSTTPPMP